MARNNENTEFWNERLTIWEKYDKKDKRILPDNIIKYFAIGGEYFSSCSRAAFLIAMKDLYH